MDKLLKITPKIFPLVRTQKATLKQLALELGTIEKGIPEIDQIIARGGFLLDTILGATPNDIDLFYSLEFPKSLGWQGCKCDEIKAEIKKLNLPLTGSRKVDLGHILEGEIFFPPIEKCLGPFSHHIEMCTLLCLDSKGDLWTTEKAIYYLKNRIEENRPDAFLQHAYYPYSDNPYYLNPNTSYIRRVVRGLRMIHTKKYTGVGPNFLEFLENCEPIFRMILSSEEYKQAIKQEIQEKCSMMTMDDFRGAIAITKTSNQKMIIGALFEIMQSKKN